MGIKGLACWLDCYKIHTVLQEEGEGEGVEEEEAGEIELNKMLIKIRLL